MTLKVVSVEDDREIAELLGVVVESPHIELFTADNGPDGLEMIRQLKPDLVMLDIMMPGMNGWDVYDTIRGDPDLKNTPIIMLSVTREGAERRRAFTGSLIDVYMTKPFDTLRLRREIGRLLGRDDLWPPPPAHMNQRPTTDDLARVVEKVHFDDLPQVQAQALAAHDGPSAAQPADDAPAPSSKPKTGPLSPDGQGDSAAKPGDNTPET
jgi:two-component system, OmpR family, alkaline phosphatase synthesis response regulator PhoP